MKNISNPPSNRILITNLIYMSMTLLSFLCFGLSFKNTKYYKLIFAGIMLVQIRTLMRLLDFENTKTSETAEKWNKRAYGHALNCTLNIILIHHNFNFTKLKKIGVNLLNISLLQGIFYLGSEKGAIADFKIEGHYISAVIGGIVLLQIFFYLYNDLYTEFFD